jgi:hypothetical protein
LPLHRGGGLTDLETSPALDSRAHGRRARVTAANGGDGSLP